MTPIVLFVILSFFVAIGFFGIGFSFGVRLGGRLTRRVLVTQLGRMNCAPGEADTIHRICEEILPNGGRRG